MHSRTAYTCDEVVPCRKLRIRWNQNLSRALTFSRLMVAIRPLGTLIMVRSMSTTVPEVSSTGASHANGLFEGERDPPMTFPASFALRERRRCRRRRAQPAQQMGLHRSSTSKPAKLRITSQTQPAMARMLAVPDQNCRDKSDKPTLVSIENDKGLKQETYRHGQGFRIGEIGLSVKAPTQPPTSELRIRFTSAAKAQNRGMPTRRPAIQTKQYRRIGIHQEFRENVVRRYNIGFFIKIRNGVESLAGSVPFRSILVPLTPT